MNLFGLTLSELQEICLANGLQKFAAKQICDWLYKKRCTSIDGMTNLSLKMREQLLKEYTLGRTPYADCQESADGTKKYLFPVEGGKFVETVYIPDKERGTICVSSQVGCKMACKFCVTGKQGFHGHLSVADILNQIVGIDEANQLTNIVFMGMGEPFDNYDNVLKATHILTSEWGFAMSPRRITVSTVGILPRIKEFLEQSQCHLAVSLHSPYGDERAELMPIQKAYAHSEIVRVLRNYNWSGQRRLSFEYIMFRGLNDDLLHAKKLAQLLHGLHCRVNLIRFHASPNVPLVGSDMNTMTIFRDYLNDNGIICTIRASRGEDIMAACGLLAGKGGDS